MFLNKWKWIGDDFGFPIIECSFCVVGSTHNWDIFVDELINDFWVSDLLLAFRVFKFKFEFCFSDFLPFLVLIGGSLCWIGEFIVIVYYVWKCGFFGNLMLILWQSVIC